MIVGGQITRKYSSTSVEIISPKHFEFLFSPREVNKNFENWSVDGNLSFVVDAVIKNNIGEPSGVMSLQHRYSERWGAILTEIGSLRLVTLGTRVAASFGEYAVETIALA